MKYFVMLLAFFIFLGCDNIGFGGAYPSIYSKHLPECGCAGVMYIIKNPNQNVQKVTLVRTRTSGTAPQTRKELTIMLQPKIEKKLGCSEINLFISKQSPYCDTHQSFYVKKYREVKSKK